MKKKLPGTVAQGAAIVKTSLKSALLILACFVTGTAWGQSSTTSIGYGSLGTSPNYKGDYSVNIGRGTAFSAGSGSDFNVFIGYHSGYSNSGGDDNAFVGYFAGGNNSTGDFNTFIGSGAGRYNTSKSKNTFIGFETGYNNNGTNNSYIGYQSGYSTTTGSGNSFLGDESGYTNTTGGYNTYLGNKSGHLNVIGYYNVFVGNRAGYSNTAGNNTMIGYRAGFNNTIGTGNVFIGKDAGYSETDSNKLYIDNSNTSSPLIWGDFFANKVVINEDLEVADKLETVALEVTSSSRFDMAAYIRHLSDTDTYFGFSQADEFIVNTDGAERLTILNDGKVGIGTSVPTVQLDVDGNMKIKSIDAIDLTVNDYIYHDGDSDTFIGFSSDDMIRMDAGGTRLVEISTDGIDISAPIRKRLSTNTYLDLNSSNEFEVSLNGTVEMKVSSTEIELPSLMSFAGNDYMEFGTNYLEVGANDTTRIWMKNDGNVKIGNNNSGMSYKLVVDGTISAEEIIVEEVGADYVFADDYELMPLKEVGEFINMNQHLPGVAPASETEKGVALGDFNEKLLEKIEELTLYLLEKDKQVDELKQEVIQLKEEISELK